MMTSGRAAPVNATAGLIGGAGIASYFNSMASCKHTVLCLVDLSVPVHLALAPLIPASVRALLDDRRATELELAWSLDGSVLVVLDFRDREILQSAINVSIWDAKYGGSVNKIQ